MVTQPRWLRAMTIAAVTPLLASFAVFIPLAAEADTAPTDAATPTTVSSDSLPTVQVNGVVWSQVIVGNTVYVGGDFTQAQPAGSGAGQNVVSRTDLLAYNLSTGALISGFAPTFNAQVRGVAASPDGSTIYAVGNFTSVNGTTRYRAVALDATTGAVKTNFAPGLNAAAYTVVATASTVYVGGAFTANGSTTRTRAAAYSASNGALLPWAPNAPDGVVRAIVVSPDASKLVLGGSFTSLNGGTSPGRGMGAVDAVTGGTSLGWKAGQTIYNGGSNASIYSLSSDGTNVYGVGYVYGNQGDGNLEGSFNARWSDGTINWIEDCHGDSYSVAAMNDAVYVVSHAHYCGNVPGGFYQTDPDPSPSKKQYALAWSKSVAGTLAHDPYGAPYVDLAGQPAPQLLTWYPDLVAGTYTGQSQAAWNVTAGNGYVLLGGEFTTVNGKRQTGLARFATKSIAPNTDGPLLGAQNWVPSAVSLAAGTVRLSWPSNWDRDNAELTYSVTRVGTATPVYTTKQVTQGYWVRPTMGFVDTGLTPGSTVSYRVKATDAFGNVAISTTVSTTVSSGSGTSAYSRAVVADGASDYWRFGEAAGPTTYDWAGYSDLTSGTGVTSGTAGAITGDGNTAATFSGTDSGLAATQTPTAGSNTFTIEAWFRTTSTSGGKIVGFGDKSTGTSSNYDRHVYMDADGKVYFGVYPGSVATVQTAKAFNDGQWHYVVASLSSDGMKLSLDGRLVGSNPSVTTAQSYNGYWRVGGDSSWNGSPFFAGDIDDVAIYPKALSTATVRAHWTASGHAAVSATPTDPYGAQVSADGPDSFWRLGDAGDATSVADASGNGVTGTVRSGVTFGATGGIRGTTDTAASFNGTSEGLIVSSQATVDPEVYTLQLWFKTTTNRGGKLIGFGSDQGGNSGAYDRHVWMLDDGRLVFGTWTGQTNTVTSGASYNDGAWHQVVTSQGADGLKMYVDGTLVGTNPQTRAQAYTGYWRIGGDTAWGGNSSDWFAGVLDDVAIYSSVLSAAQVSNAYELGAAVTNKPPTAAFTAAPADLDVAFDGSGSADADGTVASYDWNYGDGGLGTGATPNHTYTTAGTYTVSLTVTDDLGATNTIEKQITVIAANVAPTAAFTAVANGLGVAFDASGSKDGDGTVASYAWDFGDGANGTGATPAHTYTTGGDKSVTLVVTDDRGATDRVTRTVTVTKPVVNPTAAFTSTPAGLDVSFDAAASSDADGTVANYAWAFGDGTTGTGVKPTHTYSRSGDYTVTLTVTDDDGNTGTSARAITVTRANVGPTASFTATPDGLKVTLDASASTDPDGTVASSAWAFGDGTTATGATTSHTYARADRYTITLTVTDDGGATGTTTRTVELTANNSAPVASYTSTPAGLTLSVDGSGSTDSDGTVASYAWTFGDGGTATGATASHTYTAGGLYDVTLVVTDNKGAQSTLKKSITITAPSTSVLARDTFDRTVTNGLGTATTGGAWTLSGTASDFSVASGTATVSTAPGQERSAYLNAVSSTSTDVTATVSMPSVQTGGTAYWGVVGRRVGSNDYNARIVVSTSGAVTLQIQRGGSVLLKQTAITGWTYTAGTMVRVRFQVVGAGTTNLQARVWRAQDSEPTTWQAVATDTTAALQTAGSVGLRSYLGSGVTSGSTAYRFADFSVQTVSDGAGSPTPPNSAPTAAFTSTSTGLTATFDGSGSTDSDGTVRSYAWDFGDGTTGTGATTSHAYAAGGTYAVRLTVTDDQNATATRTADVAVTAPVGATHLAQDAFSRSVASGFGSADVGGAWTVAGGATRFSVGSGSGVMSVPNGTSLSAYLGGVSALDTDVQTTIAVPVLGAGGSVYGGVVGRRVGSADYGTYAIVSASGAVSVAVQRSGSSLSTVALNGVTASAGSLVHVRMLTTTTNGTTTLRARVWLDGAAQPSTWQITTTDSTAGLQAEGSIGVRAYVSAGVTNSPLVVRFDDLLADRL